MNDHYHDCGRDPAPGRDLRRMAPPPTRPAGVTLIELDPEIAAVLANNIAIGRRYQTDAGYRAACAARVEQEQERKRLSNWEYRR